jgi:hypothetical protein
VTTNHFKPVKLLTKELEKKLPPLYSQDGLGDEAMAFVKIFTPDSNITWYITERDPETNECFGLVCGLEREYGYFNIDELQELRGPLGLPLERDRYFEPTPVKLCK